MTRTNAYEAGPYDLMAMDRPDRINAMCATAERLSRTLRVHMSVRKASDPVWLRRAHLTLLRLAREAGEPAGEPAGKEPKTEYGQS